MASALLSTSLFLPSRSKQIKARSFTVFEDRGDTGGFRVRSSRSSFHGELLSKANLVRREISSSARGRLEIASVVTQRETVVPDPDYRIPIVLLGMAGGLAYTNNLLPAAPVGLLGLLLLFQTTRVRFVFDNEALEVKVGEELQESGENVFVGGENRWKYSTFVNWELWWPNFPILVYFKETQTKPEGQVHFFPVIFNGKQLYDVMVERAGPSKTSGPK
ncbi:uncharacterized protein LOC130134451 isoform X1 [Syzygium oleosum]|uniref:uncharacterized protein LOC130134451 isoform X1 n=1 Tax=Syzygium oleosum TaxID=219896 RepID=UPI0024BBDBC5|nr:uncharacterized protein LOC130134451 isoform X1 [Syzygium oleosum]